MSIVRRVTSGASAFVVACSSLMTLAIPMTAYAAGQTCAWTGAGTDTKLSTAANWSGCGVAGPQDGDTVVFDTAAIIGSATSKVELSITNDTNPALAGLKTDDSNTSTSSYITLNITFDTVKLADGATIEYDSKSDYQPKGHLDFNALVALGSLTIKGSATNAGQQSWFTQDIGSTYTIPGVLIADGSNVGIACGTSIGGLMISNSGYAIFADDDGCTIGYPITINAPLSTIYAPLRFSSEFVSDFPPFTVSGAITIPSDTAIDVNAAVKLTGTITGGNITKTPSSTGTLAIGSELVTNPVKSTAYEDDKSTEIVNVAENETATMKSGSVRSSAAVYKGGILKGVGVIKNALFVDEGGTVAPGMSPGCLTSDTLRLAGTYLFEIGGTEPCTNYDQLKVLNALSMAAAVTLDDTSATLTTSLYNGFVPKKGQILVIIDQGGDKAVKGTFKDLPEGATFTQNGVVFQISYKGGTGNDVTLTVQSVPAVPDTGFAFNTAQPAVLLAIMTALSAAIVLSARRANKLKSARR